MAESHAASLVLIMLRSAQSVAALDVCDRDAEKRRRDGEKYQVQHGHVHGSSPRRMPVPSSLQRPGSSRPKDALPSHQDCIKARPHGLQQYDF